MPGFYLTQCQHYWKGGSASWAERIGDSTGDWLSPDNPVESGTGWAATIEIGTGLSAILVSLTELGTEPRWLANSLDTSMGNACAVAGGRYTGQFKMTLEAAEVGSFKAWSNISTISAVIGINVVSSSSPPNDSDCPSHKTTNCFGLDWHTKYKFESEHHRRLNK